MIDNVENMSDVCIHMLSCVYKFSWHKMSGFLLISLSKLRQ